MQTFSAQLKTDRTDLDVSITLTDKSVQIDAGQNQLGRWSTKQCRFERLAPAAYELRLPDERILVQVADDTQFRAALALIRQEQGFLVPRPLLWVGVTAIAAAIVASAVIGGEPEAQAQIVAEDAAPTPATTTPNIVETTLAPVGSEPLDQTPSAVELLERWNDIATGTVLELDGIGVNELTAATVTIADGMVAVDAVPTGSLDDAEMIMGALGITVATADPSIAPPGRADLLAQLGIRVNDHNTVAIHTSIRNNDIVYTLDYEPGTTIRFEAGWEW